MTLAERLSRGEVLHMRADVAHARRGPIRHAFRYRADFMVFAPEKMRPKGLMSKDGFNLFSYRDADHGGPRRFGTGPAWAWDRLQEAGLERRPGRVVALLTQPRFLGHWFNPVSFWMALDGDDLIAVIAEVNNTFGQRHCYLCRHEGFTPIGPETSLTARKVFHVSPFQNVSGDYRFGFNLRPDRLAVRIRQIDGDEGLDASMMGRLEPLTVPAALRAGLRRPGGSLRVVALIHWHALRLKLKGAAWRNPPPPPEHEISR